MPLSYVALCGRHPLLLLSQPAFPEHNTSQYTPCIAAHACSAAPQSSPTAAAWNAACSSGVSASAAASKTSPIFSERGHWGTDKHSSVSQPSPPPRRADPRHGEVRVHR